MKRKLTPIKAIRLKCLDCSLGNRTEIKECPVTGCPIYPYRLGKLPKETPYYDDGVSRDQHDAMAKRAREMYEKRIKKQEGDE